MSLYFLTEPILHTVC